MNRFVSVLAFIAVAGLAATPGIVSDDEQNSHVRRSDTSRAAAGCPRDAAVAVANLDGDGRPDTAFIHGRTWPPDRIGICLGNGAVDTVRVDPFEGTVFYFADLNSDGREEIVYGGTSACGGGGAVAVVVGRKVQRVKRPDGTDLDVFEGCAGEGGRGLYLCAGDLLIEVLVEPRGGEAVWTREVFALDGDRAHVVERVTERDRLLIDGFAPRVPAEAEAKELASRPCETHV